MLHTRSKKSIIYVVLRVRIQGDTGVIEIVEM